jgi:hypothetical protein
VKKLERKEFKSDQTCYQMFITIYLLCNLRVSINKNIKMVHIWGGGDVFSGISCHTVFHIWDGGDVFSVMSHCVPFMGRRRCLFWDFMSHCVPYMGRRRCLFWDFMSHCVPFSGTEAMSFIWKPQKDIENHLILTTE